jgi:hypothetical protein
MVSAAPRWTYQEFWCGRPEALADRAVDRYGAAAGFKRVGRTRPDCTSPPETRPESQSHAHIAICARVGRR